MHKTSKYIRQRILKVLWRKVKRKMVEGGVRGHSTNVLFEKEV